MSVSIQPHASWADVYDHAYELSFGQFYDALTTATVDTVAEIIQPPARIIDFGAGTGRLSVPLLNQGYEVTAVEPCREMLEQLQRKDPQKKIVTVCSKMEDYSDSGIFDAALCVFTVLAYFLDEESLTKSLTAAYDSLKSGGILLVDIPSEWIFQGYSRNDDSIERSVSVTPTKEDLFTYKEHLKVKNDNGGLSEYHDEFSIRYWPKEHVITILEQIGFVCEKDLSSDFSGSGSHYYMMKKPNEG